MKKDLSPEGGDHGVQSSRTAGASCAADPPSWKHDGARVYQLSLLSLFHFAKK